MKLAVAGAGGYWGPNWVRVLKQLGALAAVCEIDPGRREAIQRRFELQQPATAVLEDYDEMLAMDLDGVFIVTPPPRSSVMVVLPTAR